MTAEPPYLVALNLTERCNLACAHCYLDAGTRAKGALDELDTTRLVQLIDEIADLGEETMVVFTGGEPTMRPDLATLIRHASQRGLMAVLGTNGTLLTAERLNALIDAGLKGAGISIDSLDPDHHDGFRGKPGAWARAMNAVDLCRKTDLKFQIHFSVTDDNAEELDAMIDFARSAGALVLNVFFLVCTGRGETVTNISAETYDRVLRRLTAAAHAEAKGGNRLMIRAKCAPHFKRMALELDPTWPVTALHGYEAGGCLAGTRYCRVTPSGKVTPCPYMETEAGDLRTQPLAEIWQDADIFRALRAPKLEGRCGSCEYSKLCGGCRARPMARDRNPMGEDFLCAYQPAGGAVIEPLDRVTAALTWTPEAEDWLARIPPFVRRFVRQKAEARVRGEGGDAVTRETMAALARERFGGGQGPPPGILERPT